MQLVLPKNQVRKQTYLLEEFRSEEWSGPAWYSVKKDKDGFPKEVTLELFIPLDLGSHSATEWEAKESAKILKKVYSKYPKLKKAYIGHIHSHHSMGAFFSGTDTQTMEDNAPRDGFFFSLIVASSKTPYAFACSYVDQYGFPQMFELDEKDILPQTSVVIDKAWKTQANIIKAKKKKTATNGAYAFNNRQQTGLFKKGVVVERTEPKTPVLTNKQAKLFDKWVEAYDRDDISYHDFIAKCTSAGIDPHATVDNGNEIIPTGGTFDGWY